jgi:ComF family protein
VGSSATSLTSLAAGAARVVVDFALPRTCAVCDRLLDAGETGVVCGRCWSRVTPMPSPQCARCGHPGLRMECSWCGLLPAFVRCVRSAYWIHTGTGAAIVHSLKYGGWPAVASAMAERMGRLAWPPDVLEERAAAIPVPLSATRLRERGYNQSELLARAIAERWSVPVWSDALQRCRATRTQTRLTPEERLANVSGAFRVRDESRSLLRNAHVVLVDDVVTTAATLNACAAALYAGGARILSYVTFGRAPAAGDR